MRAIMPRHYATGTPAMLRRALASKTKKLRVAYARILWSRKRVRWLRGQMYALSSAAHAAIARDTNLNTSENTAAEQAAQDSESD